MIKDNDVGCMFRYANHRMQQAKWKYSSMMFKMRKMSIWMKNIDKIDQILARYTYVYYSNALAGGHVSSTWQPSWGHMTESL